VEPALLPPTQPSTAAEALTRVPDQEMSALAPTEMAESTLSVEQALLVLSLASTHLPLLDLLASLVLQDSAAMEL